MFFFSSGCLKKKCEVFYLISGIRVLYFEILGNYEITHVISERV